MLKVTNILNPLTGIRATSEYTWEAGKTLADYIGYEGECVVGCDGGIIDLPVTEIYPANTEQYVVMAIPAGGDRTTWRNLANVTLGGAAFIFPHTWVTAAAIVGGNLVNLFLRDKEPRNQALSQSYAWQYQSSPAAAHGTAMPVVYGKARVRPVIKNRFVKMVGDKQYLYALYGIAAHKVDERDLPTEDDLPLPYGTEYVLADDQMPGASFLNKSGMPYGHGTASFAEDIVVNGRAIEDYNADVDWDTRPGLPEQVVIPGFDATYTDYAQNTQLYLDSPAVNSKTANIRYDSKTNRVKWDMHDILWHGETYSIQADASAFAPSHTYYVYYDPTLLSTRKYYLRVDTPPTEPTAYVIASFRGTATGITDLEYTTLSPTDSDDDWYSSALVFSGAHNIEAILEFPYGLYGARVGAAMTNASCRIFAQYREHNDVTWINFNMSSFGAVDYIQTAAGDIVAGVITRNTPKIMRISIKVLPDDFPDGMLDPTKTYDVRIMASAPVVVNLVNVMTVVYGTDNADTTWEGFTYPGEPLLGIKALASGQISGDLDVQVDVERSLVWVYNGAVWVQKPASNHAWAVYDILAQGHPNHPAYPYYGNANAESVYGCGVSKDRLDYTSFAEWADYVDDLEYSLNIVFDTFLTAWDAILRICQEGRGMVFPIGTKIFAFVDKPASVSQVFTMGNIHLGTFAQQYLDANAKANMVEATYYDSTRNYERTMVAVRTPDWDSSSTLSNPTSITLYGTVGFDQAVSIAQFLLLSTTLIDHTITFGVDVEALGVQAGDVVEVQHDALTTGQGGRIVSVNVGSRSITFDRTLSIASGTTYELVIYHGNGTIERKTVTGASDTATLTWGPGAWVWDTTPAAYELYSFGVAGTHTKKYRVTSIGRTNELMRTLTLIQYDEAIYGSYSPQDGVPDAGDGQYASAKVVVGRETVEETANLLNIASNLTLRQVFTRNDVTGRLQPTIIASWDTVQGDPRGTWEVWFRDVDASDLGWQGEWERTGDGYAAGDKVEHDGSVFVSLEDSNTSQPINI